MGQVVLLQGSYEQGGDGHDVETAQKTNKTQL